MAILMIILHLLSRTGTQATTEIGNVNYKRCYSMCQTIIKSRKGLNITPFSPFNKNRFLLHRSLVLLFV